jgi:hypothetical protein
MSDYFVPLRRIAILILVGYAVLGVISPLLIDQEAQDVHQASLPGTENYAPPREAPPIRGPSLPIVPLVDPTVDVPAPEAGLVQPPADEMSETTFIPSPYKPASEYTNSDLSTRPVSVTPVSWSNSYGYYRIERRTVYDEEEVTTYRTSYEPVREVREVTRYRPQWITETRQRTYKVRRPIVETACRQETYNVCRPVTRTECRERTYQVSRWVQETSVREETYEVRRPRWEEGEREVRETILEPVEIEEMRERVYTVQDPIVTYRCDRVDQGAFVDQPQYVEGRTFNRLTWKSGATILNPATGRTEYRPPGFYNIPVQEPGHYTVQKAWRPNIVEVTTPVTSYVPREVREQVPVTVRRMEPREIVRNVPYREMRYITETAVREVPETNWVQKTETVTENYPVTTTTWETVEQVRNVPVTEYRWVEEERTEEIPVRVCKRVPYTEEVCETRYVRKCEPVTHTVRRPRVVCYRIAVDACGNPLPSESSAPAPVDANSSEPTLAENAPASDSPIQEHRVGEAESIALDRDEEDADREDSESDVDEEPEIDPNDLPRTLADDAPMELVDPSEEEEILEDDSVEESREPVDPPFQLPMPSELRPLTPSIAPPELGPNDRVPRTIPVSRNLVV